MIAGFTPVAIARRFSSSAIDIYKAANARASSQMSTPLFQSFNCCSPFSLSTPFCSQRRGMADEKAVKNRMRSVRSIQKVGKVKFVVAKTGKPTFKVSHLVLQQRYRPCTLRCSSSFKLIPASLLLALSIFLPDNESNENGCSI